jgi:hypothetical protein
LAREEFEAQQRIQDRLAEEEREAAQREAQLVAQEAITAEKRKMARLAEEQKTLAGVDRSRRAAARRREAERLQVREDLIRKEQELWEQERMRLERDLAKELADAQRQLDLELHAEEKATRERLVMRLQRAREVLSTVTKQDLEELSLARRDTAAARVRLDKDSQEPAPPATPAIRDELALTLSVIPRPVLARELGTRTTADVLDLLGEGSEEARDVLLAAVEEPMRGLLAEAAQQRPRVPEKSLGVLCASLRGPSPGAI